LKKRLGWLENKELYIHGTVLTPKYGLIWLKSDEREQFDKNLLSRAVENFLIKHPVKRTTENTEPPSNLTQSSNGEPPKKRHKLMSFLDDEDDFLASMSNRRSVSKQVDEYLSTIRKITKESRENTRLFWLKYENDWPELAAYTKAVLTVPASSAAVERVFSVGGAILRPSGRRLTDRLFEMLMFLKCNWYLFKNEIKI
jgi:hypothetical protein